MGNRSSRAPTCAEQDAPSPQLAAAFLQHRGAIVFVKNALGVANVHNVPSPEALPRPLFGVPVYERALGPSERLSALGCGGAAKLSVLLSQDWSAPAAKARHMVLNLVLRRVASARAAAAPEALFDKAKGLRAAGDCVAAVVMYEHAIKLGHLPSRAHLASMLIHGRVGVDMCRGRALRLARDGAHAGCPHSKGVLACCYVWGWGCSKDETQGLRLARESVACGSEFGHFSMGGALHYGCRGVERDAAAAAAHYRSAAAQGLDAAQFELGQMYGKGYGVTRDAAAALRWYMLAANQGYIKAFFIVASYHEQGQGGNAAPDLDTAIRWYRRARAAGSIGAADALKRLGM
jgi:TPR repeat protein